MTRYIHCTYRCVWNAHGEQLRQNVCWIRHRRQPVPWRARRINRRRHTAVRLGRDHPVPAQPPRVYTTRAHGYDNYYRYVCTRASGCPSSINPAEAARCPGRGADVLRRADVVFFPRPGRGGSWNSADGRLVATPATAAGGGRDADDRRNNNVMAGGAIKINTHINKTVITHTRAAVTDLWRWRTPLPTSSALMTVRHVCSNWNIRDEWAAHAWVDMCARAWMFRCEVASLLPPTSHAVVQGAPRRIARFGLIVFYNAWIGIFCFFFSAL